LSVAPNIAFVFPGQGSQKVGMGKAWVDRFAESRAVFEEADQALGEALGALCFEGPAEGLQLTANTQPAILTASIAMYRVLASRVVAPSLVAGHSLGEYSALVAAGALTFADAVRLVRIRGRLMQDAVPVGVGAMAAILGLEAAVVDQVAREATTADETCAVANYNSPEQTVIAGHTGAVERAMKLAKERGAKRALPLPVSAPFHSPLMAPARAGLEPQLEATAFGDPRVPVVTNVDAAPVTQGSAARQALIRQVDGAVRWVESVRWMAGPGGISTFVEVGPGAVLTGLGKRIAPEATWLSLQEPEQLDELVAKLAASRD
jgi:[acyl-carrier-protein] S-malonyltransferase